jgi:valyl-tRNA synthetase
VRDVRIADDRLEASRNFANKLWNASRLVLSNLEGYDPGAAAKTRPDLAARWITSRLAATIAQVRAALATYRFSDASATLYQFVWSELCDWYLEIAKLALYQTDDPGRRLATQHTLVTSLETTLRLLHPVMPFITEELWQRVAPLAAKTGETIMLQRYPKSQPEKIDEEAEREVAQAKEVVNAGRNLKAEMKLAPQQRVPFYITAAPSDTSLSAVDVLVRPSEIRVVDDLPAADSPVAVAARHRIMLRVEVDAAVESERLRKEVARAEGMLANERFVQKAPAEVVDAEREKLERYRRELAILAQGENG